MRSMEVIVHDRTMRKNAEFEFGLETAFAVTATLGVVNLIRFVDIKFGRESQVTHLTTRPYLVSMVLLTAIIVEVSFKLAIADIFGVHDWGEVLQMLKRNSGLRFLAFFLQDLKLALLYLFILTRTFEH